MALPANLTVGDSANWADDPFLDGSGNSYDSSAYTLKYELRGPGNPITLNAAANGQGWKTTLDAAAAAGLAAGTWFWAAILTATGQRITIARGEVNVMADLSLAIANFDGRTTAEKALADAEAALATWRSSGGRMKKYTIGSRSMEFAAASEILEIISYWKVVVANERKAKAIANGLGDPSKLLVRFN